MYKIMKVQFTCALLTAGPPSSQPVPALKLENLGVGSSNSFFTQSNICLIPRQYFPTQPLLATEMCSCGLHSALYCSLLFISGCIF